MCRPAPRFLVCVLAVVSASSTARAQGCGCVAVQNNVTRGLVEGDLHGNALGARQWMASLGFRWFRSDRVFVGDVEQPALYGRMTNEVLSFDASLTYAITDRWSVTVDMPVSDGRRTSAYEHDGVDTYTMTAAGPGDLRLTADAWILDPRTAHRGNVAVGFGVVFPTGLAGATDTAHRATGPVERPVDASIQPGVGAWGVVLQLQAYLRIHAGLFAYADGFYLVRPQEQNGTEYTQADLEVRSAPLGTTPTRDSAPDQYVARLGLGYVLWPAQGLSMSVGGRVEGIPVHDLVGGDGGFRRPGAALAVEPGLTWSYRGNALSLTVPVAVYRDRVQSVPEAAAGQAAGPAAFADVSVLARYTRRF